VRFRFPVRAVGYESASPLADIPTTTRLALERISSVVLSRESTQAEAFCGEHWLEQKGCAGFVFRFGMMATKWLHRWPAFNDNAVVVARWKKAPFA